VYLRLRQHLRNILVLEQHGGRKMISNERAAFELTDVFTSVNHKIVHTG